MFYIYDMRMSTSIIFFLLITLSSCDSAQDNQKAVLVIHGGAGSLSTDRMSDSLEQAYRNKLSEALIAGRNQIASGGSSLEAVQKAITIMEDSPLFNSGKGAVFTYEGINELDASIMDGKTGMAGAVSGVTSIKNPIQAAVAVMQHSPHVMLSGKGAESFAISRNLDTVPNRYFHTEINYQRHIQNKSYADEKYGTVGAVALDLEGNISAGTSTGGMTNKRYGRIGDSPIIGAGTYAENNVGGISATGHGEFFIRNVVAYDIIARVKYQNQKIAKAANDVIHTKLKSMGGAGGVIGLSAQGSVTMPFNTEAMSRGYITLTGDPVIMID